MEDRKRTDECAVLGRTDATQCLVVGDDVYDPLLFAPELVRFNRKQYLFLNAYRLGVPLEEACQKAQLSMESAKHFLNKVETQAWLKDRALKDHIKREWEEPGKWWELGNAVLEGKKTFTKAQVVIFQEFGNRICPKLKEPAQTQEPSITININPGSVQEAFRRQESIEADLLEPKP